MKEDEREDVVEEVVREDHHDFFGKKSEDFNLSNLKFQISVVQKSKLVSNKKQ